MTVSPFSPVLASTSLLTEITTAEIVLLAAGGLLTIVALLFFVSGFAALLYQVAWQRVLFAAVGSNIQSVTIVVAVFMLGLGVGAMLGGLASKRFPSRLPLLFCLAELGIGGFGLFSVPLMHSVGAAVATGSLFLIDKLTH